jgi:hypothetical protein
LARIEKVAGKTIGQIGAVAVEPAGGEFSDLMESWAEFSKVSSRSAPAAINGPSRAAISSPNPRR